jgi:protein gp37
MAGKWPWVQGPVYGCTTPCSLGNGNGCWAYAEWERRACFQEHYGCGFHDRIVWNEKRAEELRRMRRGRCVVYFMTDPAGWAAQTWEFALRLASECPQHQFMLLSKRDYVARFLPPSLPRNIWLGRTARNQAEYDAAVKDLARLPGHRYLMLEPIESTIDLQLSGYIPFDWVCVGARTPEKVPDVIDDVIDEVILQCESVSIPVWTKASNGAPVRQMPPELAAVCGEETK